jgi:hypothetical protein
VQLQAQFFISLAKFWCSICKHELILPFLQPFGKISANLGCAVAWAGPMLDEPTRPFILSTTFSMIISSSPSISFPKGKSQISTNSVSLNGDGTVNFSSYVENNDFLDTLTQDEDINTVPAPHQESQESESESESGKDSTASDFDAKKEAAIAHLLAETPTKTNDKAARLPIKKFLVLIDCNTLYQSLPFKLKQWLKRSPPKKTNFLRLS